MNNIDPSSARKQHDETTFIDIVALYIRKRRLFLGIFISFAIVFAGGSIARSVLSPNRKSSAYKAIAKAILIDPYFAEAGEFCVGVAASDAITNIVAVKTGPEIAAGYRKDAIAAYDSKRKIFSLTVKGRDEVEARALVMAGMEAIRTVYRETGSERFAAIASRLEVEAAKLAPGLLKSDVGTSIGQNSALNHFIEGYAQAKADRIELETLVVKQVDSQDASASTAIPIEQRIKAPEDLLISDLISARSTEQDRKSRLDAFVTGTSIPAQEAAQAADARIAQILFSRIGVLREIRPTILVKFEVIDLAITYSQPKIFGTVAILAIIAAFFLAAFAVLIAGYVDKIKADPEAMRILRESRMRKQGGTRT
ncbi:MAG: hypothetical protein ACYC1A_02530 [Spirochaetales bacterium]